MIHTLSAFDIVPLLVNAVTWVAAWINWMSDLLIQSFALPINSIASALGLSTTLPTWVVNLWKAYCLFIDTFMPIDTYNTIMNAWFLAWVWYLAIRFALWGFQIGWMLVSTALTALFTGGKAISAVLGIFGY